MSEDSRIRKELFSRVRRVVVKVGSAVLTGTKGLNLVRIHQLSDQLVELRQQNIQVLLVSSGAVSAGMRKLGMIQRPKEIPQQQAAAAIGQSLLMQSWEEGLRKHEQHIAQVLLTAEDLGQRHRYLNASYTLETLFQWGVLPILNENDTVAVDEIKFGDNDQLAAMISGLVGADLVVLLTDMEGLYDKDPRVHDDAFLVPFLENVDQKVFEMVGHTGSSLGKGGMMSKLLAAQKCMDNGVPLVIASGNRRDTLTRLFEGQTIGTLFFPRSKAYVGKKWWLAHLSKAHGELLVDQGAAVALREKGGSLLPIGIVQVKGQFDVGAVVRCVSPDGQIVGTGLANYSAKEIESIKGCRSEQIEQKLGYKHTDEVIHRDHFVLTQKTENKGSL